MARAARRAAEVTRRVVQMLYSATELLCTRCWPFLGHCTARRPASRPHNSRADPLHLCCPTEMLPWNPPTSFSTGNDSNAQQQQYRPNYSQDQPQQQQQQGQPQQQQGQPNQQQQPAGGPPAYPPMTLASTLHFLQSEHRRYARDRNEWEIERAEMRARIALLEGEKRGNEGALRDLGRRCKMLENALRGER